MQRRVTGSDRILLGVLATHLVLSMVFGAMFLQGLRSDEQSVTVQDVPAAAGSSDSGAGDAAAEPSGGATPAPATSPGATTEPDGAGSTPGESANAPSQQQTGGEQGEATSGGSGSGDSGDDGGEAAEDQQATSDEEPLPEGPIKIGTLVTQTGAINFRSAAQATKAYIDRVNAEGGVHGRTIELLLRDDGLDPARGRRAVEEMLNEGVFAFVGFTAPLTEPSINPTLEQNEIPLVGAFGITASDWGYMFNGFYESFGWTSSRFLADEGVQTPGLIYISRQDDEVDARIEESWIRAFDSKGVTLNPDNIFGVDVTKANYDDVVTSLRLNGVDGIATSIDQTAVIRLQQSLNRANFAPVHAASQLADDPKVLGDPDVGASLEGTFVYSEVNFLGEQTGQMPTYEQAVRDAFGEDAELNWAGKNNWVSTRLFIEALDAAGPDPTRGDLMAALNAFSDHQTGMSAPLTIGETPTSHIRNNRCVKMGVISGGQVEPISDFDCYDGPLL